LGKGILLVVSGPSGAGKGTVLRDFKGLPYIHYSISATTRSCRQTEEDGVHYHFISQDAFLSILKDDGFIEYAEYCGDYYGTPKKAVDDALAAGKVVILEIETVGASKIKEKFPDCVSLFITPSKLSELKRRLINRGTESIDKIEKRIARARLELLEVKTYDYIVLNDRIEDAVHAIHSIILAEQSKASRMVDALANAAE